MVATITAIESIDPVFAEGLPNGKSIRWTPSTGRLIIQSRRDYSEYHLTEFACEGGRGFHFAKVTAGTDREADSYATFVADERTADAGFAHDSCECRGFLRHGDCKHLNSVRAVIANSYLWSRIETPAPVAEPADPTPEQALEQLLQNLGLTGQGRW